MNILFGHAGMQGNEREDKLASTAPVSGIITIDKSEIIKKVFKPMLADDPSKT